MRRTLAASLWVLVVACDSQSPDSDETPSVGTAADSGVPEAATGTGGTDASNQHPIDATSGHDSGAPEDSGRAGQLDAYVASDAGRGEAPNDAGTTVGNLPKPSAGCGKSARPSGGRISVQGDHNYTFPATYDGSKAFPLLIGFHAANNPIDQIENLTKGSSFETTYVRAFPKSKGSAWDYAADMANVLAMYDDLLANHCIDTNRVFATGHSSGAQLIVQILTPAHKTDADHLSFRAVAPVAASRYGAVSRPIPVLYVQAQHDTVRNSDGSDVVREFTLANGCAATSKAYSSVASCMSSGKTVTNGCIEYDGCKAATVWCSHDDPQYSNTFHGWPCFATKAMSDFFASLP